MITKPKDNIIYYERTNKSRYFKQSSENSYDKNVCYVATDDATRGAISRGVKIQI